MHVAHLQRLRALAAATLVALVITGCAGADGSDSGSSLDTKSADASDLDPSRIDQPAAGAPNSNANANANGNGNANPPASIGFNDLGAIPPVASTDPKVTNPPVNGTQPVDTTPVTTKPSTPDASAPAPKPAPAPAPAPAPIAANSVDTMVSDMTKLNDLVLKGVDPKYGFAKGPGYVIMGNDPRGTNTPDWYKASYPWMNNGNYWNYLLPWFVQFEGVGNEATNTRIQMRNMKVFIKGRSSGTWYKVNKSDGVGGILCPQGSNYFHCPQGGVLKVEAPGTVSSLPVAAHNLHGWWGSRESIQGNDIAAVVVTLQARLAVGDANRGDDRAKAKYLIQVGADYYPTNGSAETVLPAVGISRAKLLTNDWQSFSMSTFSDVGKQEPGGGVTAAQMKANPPPLD